MSSQTPIDIYVNGRRQSYDASKNLLSFGRSSAKIRTCNIRIFHKCFWNTRPQTVRVDQSTGGTLWRKDCRNSPVGLVPANHRGALKWSLEEPQGFKTDLCTELPSPEPSIMVRFSRLWWKIRTRHLDAEASNYTYGGTYCYDQCRSFLYCSAAHLALFRSDMSVISFRNRRPNTKQS